MNFPRRFVESVKRSFGRLARFSRERPHALVARSSIIAMLLLAFGLAAYFYTRPPEISLTEFMGDIAAKRVTSAEVLTNNFGYEIYATVGGHEFTVKAPLTYIDKSEDGKDGTNILQALKASGADIRFANGWQETLAVIIEILSPVLFLSLLALMGIAMLRDSTSAWMTVIRNVKTQFKDVAGMDEAKGEIKEILDFLTGAVDLTAVKARTPKGVLLSGPPGTGKTLLAKALAGEAGTSFIAVSGSDFQSTWFGGSSRRVRSLFRHARSNKPCVVFIDEFDAVASKRSGNGDAISKENNGMLNQLLVQMDGFDDNEGIVVVAATNLPENLDPAVKRAGRMDRMIEVGLPDMKGRAEILKVHSADHPLELDVDLNRIARGLSGFTGADIANLVNEAAIFACRAGRAVIGEQDFERAKNRIIMGLERRSFILSDDERRLTAFHEAGHALAATLCEHSDPVHRVTIVPHGRALGMVVRIPERDRASVTLAKLKDDLVVTMAGRAAEKVVFGDDQITTGAQSDIEQATIYATEMVTSWGFSPAVGMIKIAKDRASNSELVESEVRAFVDVAFQTAVEIMQNERESLSIIAEALLEREHLEGGEVRRIVEDARRGRKAA